MTKTDYLWAKFIWKEALQRSIRILVLGIDVSSVATIQGGTEFKCISGTVKVQHQGSSNTFRITITPNERNQILIENVLLENIADTISDSIEHLKKTQNHESHEIKVAV